VILFHTTTAERAAHIVESGFIDGRGQYLTRHDYSGVWVADSPVDINEGAGGDTLLEVEVSLSDAKVSEYEVIETAQGSGSLRTFLIPAEILNARSSVRIVDQDASLGSPQLR